ncbi:hypothetical protein TWF694_002112 [Orbilia ellipsospora]|uniref:F-box domain-containing protein n=1 Tax=Orbilia ellipsospora TaxID=2528407 RepID=A0AAV9X4T1_9PEZI
MASQPKTSILSLPVELQIQILSHLRSFFDAQACASTICPLWRDIILNDTSLHESRYAPRTGFAPLVHKVFQSNPDMLVLTVQDGEITKYQSFVDKCGLLDFPFVEDALFSPFTILGYGSVDPRSPYRARPEEDMYVLAPWIEDSEDGSTTRTKEVDTVYFLVSISNYERKVVGNGWWVLIGMKKNSTIKEWMKLFYETVESRVQERAPESGGSFELWVQRIHMGSWGEWYLDVEIRLRA